MEEKKTLKEILLDLQGTIQKAIEVCEQEEKPETKPETKPHLEMLVSGEFLGNIVEPTNYKDVLGRPLFIGDTVDVFDKDLDNYGEDAVVRDEDKAFIMGCKIDCNETTGKADGWNLIKKRSYGEIGDGELVRSVKYCK